MGIRLIEQIIKKKMELYEEFLYNKYYLRAISLFYSAYSNALSVMNEKDLNVHVKNRMFAKCFSNPDKINQNEFIKLFNFIEKDMNVINRALVFIAEEKKKLGEDVGTVYIEGTIGMLATEYPDEVD